MNVDRIRPALVVLLGVLAISAAAASMDGAAPATTTGATSDGDGMGEGPGDGFSPDELADQSAGPNPPIDVFNFVRWFLILVFGGGALAYLGYVAYELWTEGVDGLRTVLLHAVTTIVPVVLAGIAFYGPYIRSMLQGQVPNPSESSSPAFSQGGGSSTAEAVDTASEAMPIVLLSIGAVVTIGVAVLVLHHVLSDEEDETTMTSAERLDDDSGPVDSVHTGTHSSLDDVDANNGVYRAWRELAATVDGVDLRTHTPTEVAAHASEHDLDQQAVSTITELFEEVRYGQRPPTADRESRAESALDRVRSEGENR